MLNPIKLAISFQFPKPFLHSHLLLLEFFKKKKFLVCSSLIIEKREVKFIDLNVRDGYVGVARGTVIAWRNKYLCIFSDVSLAVITLNFIGRVQDILNLFIMGNSRTVWLWSPRMIFLTYRHIIYRHKYVSNYKRSPETLLLTIINSLIIIWMDILINYYVVFKQSHGKFHTKKHVLERKVVDVVKLQRWTICSIWSLL